MKCTKLEPEDLVLVRQKTFKGKHTFHSRWKNPSYQVIKHVGEHLPVYKVQMAGENTNTRTLHRNLLFTRAFKNKSDETQQNLGEKKLN